jgi:hypothetical protein
MAGFTGGQYRGGKNKSIMFETIAVIAATVGVSTGNG